MTGAGDVRDRPARVASATAISPTATLLELRADEAADREALARARAGQFLPVLAWDGPLPLLRRPMSVLDACGDAVSILVEAVGPGSRRIAALESGARVRVLGPLGRAFGAPRRDGAAVFVAGGYGVAPFVLLARDPALGAGRERTLILGARDGSRLYLADRMRSLGANVRVTTESGEVGRRGRVTGELAALIAARGASWIGQLYACGPEPMLVAVARMAREHGVPCEVSLDRVMACGVGVCMSCVCLMGGEDSLFHYRRTCIEGPVIDEARLPADGVW